MWNQDFCNIKESSQKDYPTRVITIFRVGMQSVNKNLSAVSSGRRLFGCYNLLAKLDRKNRRSEFGALTSHTLSKAILNNLTGNDTLLVKCSSQLVRNGKYEAVDRKSSRLVFQEVSDLWRATTPDAVNISDNFSQREFTLQVKLRDLIHLPRA